MRNTLRNRLVVWFTAIFNISACTSFSIFYVSNVRFYAYDFYRADVGANSKTEIHLTNTAVEVGMQCHIYAMSLLLNARVTLLR